ncbi:MAG: hypothetical protein K2P46_02095, partial [Alistipes sp.]|nr:hypothetical protein [Alistipes sp.]
ILRYDTNQHLPMVSGFKITLFRRKNQNTAHFIPKFRLRKAEEARRIRAGGAGQTHCGTPLPRPNNRTRTGPALPAASAANSCRPQEQRIGRCSRQKSNEPSDRQRDEKKRKAPRRKDRRPDNRTRQNPPQTAAKCNKTYSRHKIIGRNVGRPENIRLLCIPEQPKIRSSYFVPKFAM